jgi:hypothetical protein
MEFHQPEQGPPPSIADHPLLQLVSGALVSATLLIESSTVLISTTVYIESSDYFRNPESEEERQSRATLGVALTMVIATGVAIILTGCAVKFTSKRFPPTPNKYRLHGLMCLFSSMILGAVLAALSQHGESAGSFALLIAVFFLLIVRGVVGVITIKAAGVMQILTTEGGDR